MVLKSKISMTAEEAYKFNYCPYCRSEDTDANFEIYKDGDGYLAIGSGGDVEILATEEDFYLYREKLFKFCPMCGRKLNKD